ncbi:4-alpha-glucanotransferase [Aliiroseovarius sp. F47248L]|uniref:4-alpha-glucanotransferase n=1 Tax=Aliiroseovarius sp. F47248L TaxID=2926420 RepID=UPI001FF3F065|nr:4-alpha-glucanotransferase [Aliiroseovarius sp. F47248L]MCK0140793.1 4-alpha-glucanotransferase [Aliiroseovarius sp. F47248L]
MTDWMSQLCTYVGVHAQYRGFDGQTIEVSRDTQVAVLQAMGLDVRSDTDAQVLLRQMQTEDAARPLPPEVVVDAGKLCKLTLARPAEWKLEAEGTGETLARGQAKNKLSLPDLPLGIHRLHLRSDAREFTTWVLARPASAIQLEDHIPEPRIWGVLAPLYGLTDGDAAQIGSYGLLGDYAVAMAAHGADFVGINPVHAMGQARPDDVVSPYSPSHRGLLNTWHCADYDGQAGDETELVDYPTALRNTARALADQFASFCDLPDGAPQRRAFKTYVEWAGIALHEFALFEVLSVSFGADWRTWPAPYRDHDADALAAFETTHKEEIARIKWEQWQADVQLSDAQDRACKAGMRVGLYLDLAVGPRLGGAETWVKDSSLITGATLGAPPDPLGPVGQSWGLAPQSPLKLRSEGYAGFARLLRSVMRHAGMIRIDHVLGLMRSFWIPDGGAEGTYVSYPFDALLAVVAIESARSNTIVVGEDLGLIPEGLREKLAASGVYGLDVLQYMRTTTGGFTDTTKTRRLAICGFATHDTPTVAGFFTAEDARVRHQFGGIDAQTLKKTHADRTRARETLGSSDPVPEIHHQLARANASMVSIQLDDIAERTSQQNLPGTVDSYPNWRLKAPFTVDEIAQSEAFKRLAEDMRAQGRSNPRRMEKKDGLQDCSDHAH